MLEPTSPRTPDAPSLPPANDMPPPCAPAPSAAAARRRAQQTHKLARARLDRYFADYQAGRTPSADHVAEVEHLAGQANDKVLTARARLLAALCRCTAQPPADLLAMLGEVMPVFDAAMLVRDRAEALMLAVRCLIDAGDPSTALDTLGSRAAEPDGPEGELRRNALRALAWLDLGRPEDAARAAGTLRERIDATRGLPTRLHADLALACIEVQLAQRLDAWGLETHLSAGAGRHRRRAGAQMPLPVSLPALPGLPPQDPAAALAAALALLELAARDPTQEQLLVRLAALVAHLASLPDAPAQAWLCVGTAYRVAGHLKPAERSLAHALDTARRLGQWRVARHALYEQSLIEARRQDFAAAYAAMAELHGAARTAPGPVGERPWWARPARPEPSGGTEPAVGHRTAAMHVRRATSHIQDHLGAKLSVADVAQACGVSRRTLEVAFRTELQTSVADYVRDLRLQAVAQRLANTQLPIKRIAHDLGYGSASSLSRDFRRATGCPPAEYRLRAATR
jgi:AraC-like DNA-binding protein